ncbi:hypothetical protein TNCV_2550041 [Trichonephila clavipes]|nr:hypothetical protein TNCV_2550041 [Trichonephila clavipes]
MCFNREQKATSRCRAQRQHLDVEHKRQHLDVEHKRQHLDVEHKRQHLDVEHKRQHLYASWSPILVNRSSSGIVFLLLRKFTGYPLRLRLENPDICCTGRTNHTWEKIASRGHFKMN